MRVLQGESLRPVAKEIDVHYTTLRNWVQKAKKLIKGEDPPEPVFAVAAPTSTAVNTKNTRRRKSPGEDPNEPFSALTSDKRELMAQRARILETIRSPHWRKSPDEPWTADERQTLATELWNLIATEGIESLRALLADGLIKPGEKIATVNALVSLADRVLSEVDAVARDHVDDPSSGNAEDFDDDELANVIRAAGHEPDQKAG